MNPKARVDQRPLLPYVPEDRKHAIATGTRLPDRSEGAALFADLSGFTALTEALARHFGPHRGAEELTRYLTVAFGALIDQVHRFRGSVIGFSGDAVTCWFDGDDGSAVMAAALAMQQAVSELPGVGLPNGDTITIGVKVAAVRGPVRRFLVGDPHVQVIDVLAGHTLDRLARCEGLAERGEVVVDDSLGDGLADPSAGARPARVVAEREHASSGFRVRILAPAGEPPEVRPWPETPDVEEPWAHAWVLPVVQERLRLGLDAQAADFRPSAALFLSFAGIDFDGDADAGARTDLFIRWAQEAVTSLGGNIIQLTFGDKGAYLYATFGAPVAHDDDAARAVTAARILLRPPQPYIEDVKIGVTYGQMYAGAYGSDTRRTFGVLGPKTNLAARLMGRARPGTVLCDEEVVRQARRQWTFEALPPVRVKGVSDPVPVYTPVAPLAASDGASRPMFGREAERNVLEAALEALGAGRHGSLLIEGEGGIGKSRLVSWLAQEARARAALPLVGNAEMLEDRAPYGTWRPILWRALDLHDAAPEERREALPARVGELVPDLVHWTPLLADATGLDLADSDLTTALAPELRRRNLIHLLTELLRSKAGRLPLVVILDDAHRMDSLSWELAVAVAASAREHAVPLLLSLAYRPLEVSDTYASALASLREPADVRVLTLAELDPTAVTALVAAALGVTTDDVPNELASLVGARASGNPFYAEELVQTLVDDGSVRVDEVGTKEVIFARRREAARDVLPGTLQGLILARVDRSPPEQQLALKVASVVGRRFRVVPVRAALESSAPVHEASLRERLEALAERALLTADSEEAFSFRHVMVHEVTYGTLLFAQRRRLHRALADWYREEGASPRELNPLLAHHYARAAEGSEDEALIEMAVHYLQATADQNDRLAAFPEAVADYGTALALVPSGDAWDERRAGLLVAVGSVLEKLGEFRTSEERFREALRRPGSERNRAAALAGLCLIHTRAGDEDQAREAGREALEVAESIGDATLAALVRGRLGIIAALAGDFAEAETHFGSAQRHYQDSDQPQNAAAWLNNLGLVLIFQERFDESRAELDTALELAREAHAQDVEAQVLSNLGLVAQRLGDLDTAATRYRASLTLSRTLLARQEAVTNVVNLGDIALARGDPDEAWTSYVEAAGEAVALGALPKALDALRGAAEVMLARSEDRPAAELLGFVLRHPAGNVEVETEAKRVLAKLEVRLEDEELRRALGEGAARTFEDVLGALRTMS